MIPFGQTVLCWRLHRGLTQQGLAIKARVPRSNLSAIEQGRREVSLRTLRALALALQIRPGVLADGIPPLLEGVPTSPLSREVMEQIAKEVVSDRPAPGHRFLIETLRGLVASQAHAAHKSWKIQRWSRRRTNIAYLQLKAHYSAGELKTLFSRIQERL